MIEGIRLKVCGLTSLVDAEFADQVGADYLGFNLHPKSPRRLTLAQYRAMRERLPKGRQWVAVMVEPTEADLEAAVDAGFHLFQIHFRPEMPLEQVAAWSERVTPARLWLAPRLAPGAPLDRDWLPLARTILVDTFQPSAFGGSGRTGDWPGFARLREAYPECTWILAGGLNPENVATALEHTGARVVDVNSGVEAGPGVKDHAKLRALALAIRESAAGSGSVASSE